MAQPGDTEVKQETAYGSEHWITFGKYKNQSVYDIANHGDFKYLEWLLKSTKPKHYSYGANKNEKSFLVHISCKPHIEAALRTKVCPGVWSRKEKGAFVPYDEQSICYETEEGLRGPLIKLKCCQECGKWRTQDGLLQVGKRRICFKCSKK